jgi:hypothetical protein
MAAVGIHTWDGRIVHSIWIQFRFVSWYVSRPLLAADTCLQLTHVTATQHEGNVRREGQQDNTYGGCWMYGTHMRDCRNVEGTG